MTNNLKDNHDDGGGDALFTQRLRLLQGRQSGSAMARQCGIHVATMLNYLNGNTSPTLLQLRRIAAAYETTVGWLVGDEMKEGGVTAGGGHAIASTVTGSSGVTVGHGNTAGGKQLPGWLEKITPLQEHAIKIALDLGDDNDWKDFITRVLDHAAPQ